MTIVVDADLTDAVHTTTDKRQRRHAEIKSDEDCRDYRFCKRTTSSEAARWLRCPRPMVEGMGAPGQPRCNCARVGGILNGRTAR
jgi:hypothetical protein